MIIRNMRWGYDGGGVACGPVEGNTLVEVAAMDKEGHTIFVVDSKFQEFEHVYVSEMPMFDLFMYMNRYKADWDYEYSKIQESTIYDCEFTIGEESDEENEQNEFSKLIQLARLAMREYWTSYNPIEATEDSTTDFAKDYIDEDIDAMELPEVKYEDDDFWEDEEDEEITD